ncbi:DUF1292 domain-containing protein [Clostridium grantii]|uniref:UPF0473 protein SAMN02745207_00248 n=1 Tax=Clostridium grantii DSM 8605 TaxID=1121316 RepID=A0A1M5QR01_9CLOT|nr:DUF1292 domain-containing protein [Clostridium grantii]SHH16527.1 Protein of unknown function [Clostridium grantii DSM 8605]
MENEIFTLKDENGVEQEFELVMKFDIEDSEYVILTALDNEEAIALKIVVDESGEEVLVTVEDEEEFKMVSEAYEALSLEEE